MKPEDIDSCIQALKDIGLDNDDQQQLEKHKLFFYGYLDSLGIKNRIIKRKLYRVHNRYTWNHHEEEPEAKLHKAESIDSQDIQLRLPFEMISDGDHNEIYSDFGVAESKP